MIPVEEIKSSYGIEMAVVIATCRVHFKTATAEELQLFIDANEIDWKTVLTICRNHSIRPIVYKILITLKIPVTIAAIIKEEYVAVIAKSWQQALETERLITLLKEHNIQAVPYKGTAFSKQFYGDLVSRESSDIDLIIKPEDLEKAIPVFKADGYLAESDYLYQYFGNHFFARDVEYNFNKFKNGMREFHIELHWDIVNDTFFKSRNTHSLLYYNTNTIKIVNKENDMLNNNAHFLCVLIHHSFKHIFESFSNIIDIGMFVHQEQITIDKEFIDKYSFDLQLKRVLSISNILSYDLFGIALTDKANDISENTRKHFLKRLLAKNRSNSMTYRRINFLKGQLHLRGTIKERAKYFIDFVKQKFYPSFIDFRIIKFPKFLFFLYYIFKPFRLLVYRPTAMEEKQRLIPKE